MIACRGLSCGSAIGCSGMPCSGAVGSATVGSPASSGPQRRAVAGDHDGVGRQVDLERHVEGRVLGGGPRRAVAVVPPGPGPATWTSGTSGSRSGMSKCTGPALPDRVPRAAARTRQTAERHCAVLPGVVLGQPEADGRAHLATEQAELLDGLVGAGPEHLVRAVRAEHHERHPRVVRLEHRGPRFATAVPEVITIGTGRLDDRGQADREESRGALVDPHVQPQPPGSVGGLQRERQRRVARTRAEHDLADSAADEFVDDRGGLGCGRVHASRVSVPGTPRSPPRPRRVSSTGHIRGR